MAAGLVVVRDVVRDGDDLVLVSDLATGGGLDARVARWGVLSAGQVVTLVVGLAETLACAHGRGLVHGRISAANVVLDGDGRPLLTNYVLAGHGDAAVDVTSLAALALDVLDDDAPSALVAALASTSDARTLAEAVRAVAPAEPLTHKPVVVTAPIPVDTVGGSPRRRGAFAVAAAVAFAIAVGTIWGRHDDAAGSELPMRSSLHPTASPVPTLSWRAVVRDVEVRRLHALAVGNISALATVEMLGTALWRHDRRTARQLSVSHQRLSGLSTRVRSATPVSVSGARMTLRVVDAMSSYDVVDRHGQRIAHVRRRAPRQVLLVLERGNSGWLLVRAVSPRSQ